MDKIFLRIRNAAEIPIITDRTRNERVSLSAGTVTFRYALKYPFMHEDRAATGRETARIFIAPSALQSFIMDLLTGTESKVTAKADTVLSITEKSTEYANIFPGFPSFFPISSEINRLEETKMFPFEIIMAKVKMH